MSSALKFDPDHRNHVGADEEVIEIDPIFEADVPALASHHRPLAVVRELEELSDVPDDVLSPLIGSVSSSSPLEPAANDGGGAGVLGDWRHAKRVMWGRLEELGLADLVQTLAANRSTGRLAVRTELGEGEIFFRAGALVSAKMSALQGVAALARMLAAVEGDFEVKAIPVAADTPLLGDVTPVLLEAMRQVDEAKRLCSELPATSHVLVLREGADFASLGGEEAVFSIAERFFEPMSVARARREDAFGDQVFFAGVQRLWQAGLLQDTGRREVLSRQTALPFEMVIPLPPPIPGSIAGSLAGQSSEARLGDVTRSSASLSKLELSPSEVAQAGIRSATSWRFWLPIGLALTFGALGGVVAATWWWTQGPGASSTMGGAMVR